MAKRTIVRRPATKKRARRKITKKMKNDPVMDSWQSMFVIAEHWQSDLIFFADEVSFFEKLLDKYFIWLLDDNNRDSTRQLISRLTAFEKERASLSREVNLHLSRLANLIENPFAHDGQDSNDKHASLENALAEFFKKFKELKKELFEFTERIVDAEKIQHLLSNQ